MERVWGAMGNGILTGEQDERYYEYGDKDPDHGCLIVCVPKAPVAWAVSRRR